MGAAALSACRGGADARPAEAASSVAATSALVEARDGAEAATVAMAPAAPAAGAGGAEDESIYLLEDTFTDAQGQPFQLARLRGRPVLLAMVFTRCEWACPRIVADFKRIDAGLAPAERAHVQRVLVSMDAARDDPASLRAFAAQHRLALAAAGAPAGGTTQLLRAEEDTITVLAAVLGIRIKKLPSGDFAHGNAILLLDAEGRVAHRQEGLEQAPDATIAALRRLGAGAP